MNILITGGTGFLGQHLARALLDQGHQVRLMGRDMAPAHALIAAGALPVVADLRDRASVSAACAGAEAVYHVGALSAPWGRRADFFAINVDGTAAGLAGRRRHSVGGPVFFFFPRGVVGGRGPRGPSRGGPPPRRLPAGVSPPQKIR